MTDVIAVPEGRVLGGVDFAAFVRTPFGGQCVRIGVAALASAVAAGVICAVLPNPASSSAPAGAHQVGAISTPTYRATGEAATGLDVATVWAEEQALLYAANNPGIRAAAANAWLPAGGVSTLLATRFPSAGNVPTVAAEAVVPMPPPAPVARLATIKRQAVSAKASAKSGVQVASLTPQAPEPGYFDFFRNLFVSPDHTANVMLAANPKTAIYDIQRRIVYLPNGDKLEAHSGYGKFMDDPESVDRKNLGVTPPNVYTVTFREKLFHGVRALRMTPVGTGKMYGRAGILAHSYMLGDDGQSNGCVSIKDYDRFLQAYEKGAFNQIIVVRSVDDTSPSRVASASPGNV